VVYFCSLNKFTLFFRNYFTRIAGDKPANYCDGKAWRTTPSIAAVWVFDAVSALAADAN